MDRRAEQGPAAGSISTPALVSVTRDAPRARDIVAVAAEKLVALAGCQEPRRLEAVAGLPCLDGAAGAGAESAVDGGVVVALVGERLLQLAAFLAGEPSLGGTPASATLSSLLTSGSGSAA